MNFSKNQDHVLKSLIFFKDRKCSNHEHHEKEEETFVKLESWCLKTLTFSPNFLFYPQKNKKIMQ